MKHMLYCLLNSLTVKELVLKDLIYQHYKQIWQHYQINHHAPVTTLPTHVAVDPITGQTGAKVILTAEVIETDNTKYLPGESVNFSVGGVAVGTAITDNTGKASLPYGVTQKAGSYPITVQFAGDSNFTASNGNNTLTVTSTPDTSQWVSRCGWSNCRY